MADRYDIPVVQHFLRLDYKTSSVVVSEPAKPALSNATINLQCVLSTPSSQMILLYRTPSLVSLL